MGSKGLLSLTVIMLVAIGSVSLSTSVAGHNVDLDGIDAMEELAFIMAATAGTELTANAMDSTKCIKKRGWSQDLTLSNLNSMMTIFKGKAWFKPEKKYIPPRTYLFVPQCPDKRTKSRGHVYVSGGGHRNHAEDNMAAQCGLPTEFYLTSAPCPDCAMMLYKKYRNYRPKPIIHIARPYRGKGKTGRGNKILNFECLAMLVKAGFTIIPWNWRHFAKKYITNDTCKAAINEMTGADIYDERYGETRKAVKFINKEMVGTTEDYHKICSDALKKKTVKAPRYNRKRKVIKGKGGKKRGK